MSDTDPPQRDATAAAPAASADAGASLGPCSAATVVCSDLAAGISAWGELEHTLHSRAQLSPAEAQRWGMPQAAGAPVAWLANALGEPWLRLIGDDTAAALPPFAHSGWLALEIAVQALDTLHARLRSSQYFRILGPPAELDVSPAIRAMQVQGPAGEVLYLTEITAPVAGFELPQARCRVDRLFIPVLLSTDRERSAQHFHRLGAQAPRFFDTRIGVINRARQLAADTRHPVATLQLAGSHLIEIDELGALQPRPAAACGLPAGIAVISMATQAPVASAAPHLLRGDAGELLELVAA